MTTSVQETTVSGEDDLKLASHLLLAVLLIIFSKLDRLSFGEIKVFHLRDRLPTLKSTLEASGLRVPSEFLKLDQLIESLVRDGHLVRGRPIGRDTLSSAMTRGMTEEFERSFEHTLVVKNISTSIIKVYFSQVTK